MRHITIKVAAAVLALSGMLAFAPSAHAGTTPPDSTVPAESDAPAGTAAASAEIEPAGGSAVVVVDENGGELAAITAPTVEPAWTGFGEDDEPQSGFEYLRVTVVVESRSPRGLFEVDDSDFILQDADGFITAADVVPTAEQDASDQDPVSDAELAEGETVELALTFEIVSGVAPTAVFYTPAIDRLVTVLELN